MHNARSCTSTHSDRSLIDWHEEENEQKYAVKKN